MSSPVEERLKKLRSLREKLCSKSSIWQEGFEIKDWLVTEIEDIRSLACSPDTSKDQIAEKAASILEALKPKGE